MNREQRRLDSGKTTTDPRASDPGRWGTRRQAGGASLKLATLAAASCWPQPQRTVCATAPEPQPTTYYGKFRAPIAQANVKLPHVRVQLRQAPDALLLGILQGNDPESHRVLTVRRDEANTEGRSGNSLPDCGRPARSPAIDVTAPRTYAQVPRAGGRRTARKRKEEGESQL